METSVPDPLRSVTFGHPGSVIICYGSWSGFGSFLFSTTYNGIPLKNLCLLIAERYRVSSKLNPEPDSKSYDTDPWIRVQIQILRLWKQISSLPPFLPWFLPLLRIFYQTLIFLLYFSFPLLSSSFSFFSHIFLCFSVPFRYPPSQTNTGKFPSAPPLRRGHFFL